MRFLSSSLIPKSRMNLAPSGGTLPPFDCRARLRMVAPVIDEAPRRADNAFLKGGPASATQQQLACASSGATFSVRLRR